jgi:uncharacterized protein YraI
LVLLGLLAVEFAGASHAQDQPAGTVNTTLANVRSGPGTGYGVVAQAPFGSVFTITGRNQAGDWLQVCCIGGTSGWIYGPLLVVEGSLAGVPVIGAGFPNSTPTPVPPATFQHWRGEYYANRNLQSSPVFVRDDRDINFHWGGASPGSGVPGTNFSVRWTRTMNFAAGNYTFYAQVDDGVRLYVDDILLIDDWRESSIRTLSQTFNQLGAGQHTIRVEYFQAGGDSLAVVWWEETGSFPEWKGEYWTNIDLQGSPAVVRNDVQLNFNWGLGSPDPAIPADNWSARWTRRVYFEPGDYEFSVNVDDGVRVSLDGRLIIDEWHDVNTWTNYTVPVRGLQGQHTIRVDYYARGGIAYCQLSWYKTSTGGGDIP